MAISKKDFSALPERYKQHFDDLHNSLNTIIQILSKIEDKTWRRKLAGICMLTLGILEFPETNLQEAPENEDETYSG